MKSIKLVAAAALALSAVATTAFAGPPDITSPSCESHRKKGLAVYDVCFTGGYPYRTGGYSALACKDPYKGARFVTYKPFLGKKRTVLTCTYN
ncbi:MAG: hypothetical protein HWE30_10860 [Methylocystaceae bacterium]|nr:hypothetical protein [Methylocystaceae bacterium]